MASSCDSYGPIYPLAPNLRKNRRVGPHLLLTSATSWMPGAAQFNLAAPPNAVLLSDTTCPQVDIFLRRVQIGGHYIQVSGAGSKRQANLRQIIKILSEPEGNMPSMLEQELAYWRTRGEHRCVLLVVNSYEQADWAWEELERQPAWQGRAMRLLPDDDPSQPAGTLRAREVERFGRHNADILIAPLMAIQRGFNILDEDDKALLGSALFLVRPYPPPEDLGPQILSMNAWTMRQLADGQRELAERFSQYGIYAMRRFRNAARGQWKKRLNGTRYGVARMHPDLYYEFLCDQLVSIWQTIGRLLRGGRDARVFFVDATFAVQEGKRHMLRDWYIILNTMITNEKQQDRQLAIYLYNIIWEAFKNAIESHEIS